MTAEASPTLASTFPDPTGDDTLGERAAAWIERDILSGSLAPGSRLAVQSLSKHYGIGTTPLREGLSRLVTRGLITAVGQRGFWVAHVSREDLDDITRLRVLIETEALMASMDRGGDAWEVGIVAALHHLRLCLERTPDAMGQGTAAFETLHKAFHRSLIAGCGSARLLALHDDLYLQAYRYRRVMLRRLPTPDWFLREHEALAEVVIARGPGAAAERLSHHLRHTLATVYGDGPETGDW